ncbi:hypothetical protein PJP07_31370, partial [Mycobacterium kansasii]
QANLETLVLGKDHEGNHFTYRIKDLPITLYVSFYIQYSLFGQNFTLLEHTNRSKGGTHYENHLQ